jgi:Protein of unknown function (DUF551)
MTCLVALAGADEPTWLGFMNDDDEWCDVTSGMPFAHPVTHWADLPTGPFHGAVPAALALEARPAA